MPILEVKNLSKTFGDFVAVDDLDFSLEKGEIFGLLGPNGAGKTTTINMLTGLARPTSGSIILSGVDCLKNGRKARQRIGIVPDESNLYEEMNGLDNLSFCASLYGMDKKTREKKGGELLKQFGLDDTGKKPFKAYSKGMKRKLTIAAGIIHDPQILFLDEPTTGIDVESARQIRQLILNLNAGGTTIFLTTHYIEEAERLCSRIGFMVSGKLIKQGTLGQLMAEAQQENVVQFTLENKPDHTVESLKAALLGTFPGYGIQITDEQTVRIRSSAKLDLLPLMRVFAENEVAVYEAKILRPSLEDVFVNITGVGLAKMKKEKEGKKK